MLMKALVHDYLRSSARPQGGQPAALDPAAGVSCAPSHNCGAKLCLVIITVECIPEQTLCSLYSSADGEQAHFPSYPSSQGDSQ